MKIMKRKDKELAKDNPKLRKTQMQRFIGSIEDVGNYFKETKQTQKLSLKLAIVWTIIILLFIGSGLVVAYTSGGLDGLFDAKAASRHFNCTSGDIEDHVRLYNDAINFVELYGGECLVYHSKEQ